MGEGQKERILELGSDVFFNLDTMLEELKEEAEL